MLLFYVCTAASEFLHGKNCFIERKKKRKITKQKCYLFSLINHPLLPIRSLKLGKSLIGFLKFLPCNITFPLGLYIRCCIILHL